MTPAASRREHPEALDDEGSGMSADTLPAAQDYCRRDWSLVAVPPGEKAPRYKGWPDLIITPEDLPRYFDTGANIAVRVGRLSGGLVDIDLDSLEALDLADLYLPQTHAEFGRASRPRSHRLFVASGAVFESFADPVTGEMLVELRADGREGGAHLSLLPPSTTSGEPRQWHGDVIAPTVIDARVLRRRVAWLAIACLVTRYISEHAAKRPSPDFPTLLWEFDHELGRAIGGSGNPPLMLHGATRVGEKNCPAVISIWPRSSTRSRTIAAGKTGTRSVWRSTPHRAVRMTGSSSLTIGP